MRQKIDDLPPVSGLKLESRTGFAYGLGEVAAKSVSGEAANVAAWLAGIAKPGQILVSAPSLDTIPESMRELLIAVGPATQAGKMKGVHVYEYSPTTRQNTVPGPEEGESQPVLRLNYGDTEVVLDGSQPIVSLGREGACDIAIRGYKVSRRHATIEFRDSRFYLVDRSTNGTFVKIGKEPEFRLHHKEMVLRGKGLIGLAGTTHADDTDVVNFELLINRQSAQPLAS